jgi:hypothetical protein
MKFISEIDFWEMKQEGLVDDTLLGQIL